MKPHKWAKEIKSWADGAEIEYRLGDCWKDCENPVWGEQTEYRIKPEPSGCLACVTCGQLVEQNQPKNPQYLYVYYGGMTEVELLAKQLGVIKWRVK